MLRRGLETAWLQKGSEAKVRFCIRPSQQPGRKCIIVETPASTDDDQWDAVIVADRLTWEYAIGAVNRMLEIYAAGTDLQPAGICDNTSNVWGVQL